MGNTAPKKRRSGGEPLATLCPNLPTWDLNPRPPAPIAMYLTTELTDQLKFHQMLLLQKHFQGEYLTRAALLRRHLPKVEDKCLWRMPQFLKVSLNTLYACFLSSTILSRANSSLILKLSKKSPCEVLDIFDVNTKNHRSCNSFLSKNSS